MYLSGFKGSPFHYITDTSKLSISVNFLTHQVCIYTKRLYKISFCRFNIKYPISNEFSSQFNNIFIANLDARLQ